MAQNVNYKTLAKQQQEYISTLLGKTKADQKINDLIITIERLDRKLSAVTKSNDATKTELTKLKKFFSKLSDSMAILEKKFSDEYQENMLLSQANETIEALETEEPEP